MRIVLLSSMFSEGMGYSMNCLPKAWASLGHEVHVITTTAQMYYGSPFYQQTYEPFLGPEQVECGVKQLDGYTLHRLSLINWRKRLGARGLWASLRRIQPQIVQSFDIVSLITMQAAFYQPILGYRLYTENHIHASVFSPATQYRQMSFWRKFKIFGGTTLPGFLVNLRTVRSYAIAEDPLEISVRFLGVPVDKVVLSPLGVDTDLFHPPFSTADLDARDALRQQFGFTENDIVCIYTGRFTEGKNPLCLATAIGLLVDQGQSFRGLFIGDGPQAEAIRNQPGCVVLPFVRYPDLPTFFRTADIGVWPMQESTSMLDAAACGLPVIVSDRVQATERIEGNGLTYQESNPTDLALTLLTLQDAAKRKALGLAGSTKMLESYSWTYIARRRLADYEAALLS